MASVMPRSSLIGVVMVVPPVVAELSLVPAMSGVCFGSGI